MVIKNESGGNINSNKNNKNNVINGSGGNTVRLGLLAFTRNSANRCSDTSIMLRELHRPLQTNQTRELESNSAGGVQVKRIIKHFKLLNNNSTGNIDMNTTANNCKSISDDCKRNKQLFDDCATNGGSGVGGAAKCSGIVKRIASSLSTQIINAPHSSDRDDLARLKSVSSNQKQQLQQHPPTVLVKKTSSSNEPPIYGNLSNNLSTPNQKAINTSISSSIKRKFNPSFHLEETVNGIQIQIKQPHLISVTNNNSPNSGHISLASNNPNKTSIKIYPLKLGRTTVGSAPQNDIVIDSVGIESEHCFIQNDLIFLDDNQISSSSAKTINVKQRKSSKQQINLVTLFPIGKLCAVDDVLVDKPYMLNSGLFFL
jgi:hypothetical protein